MDSERTTVALTLRELQVLVHLIEGEMAVMTLRLNYGTHHTDHVVLRQELELYVLLRRVLLGAEAKALAERGRDLFTESESR